MSDAIIESEKSTNVRTVKSKKSTNVRVLNTRERLLRGGIGLLDRISPRFASLAAERLFLTPRGHERPEWESAMLGSARRGSVLYGNQQLPTYTWGEGFERVLLLHGWEGRGSQLAAFVPPLLAAGYQVIAVDLPGHGDAAPALSSVVDFGHAVSTLVQRLGPFAGVIGHSMGAAATALAHTFSNFEARLVLIGAPRSPRGFLDGFTRYLGLSARAKAGLEQRIAQRFGLGIDAVDVARLGPSIALPTLIIHDQNDNIVPFEHGLALVAALPQASLMSTAQLGHRRILRDASVIAAAVSFIQRNARFALHPAQASAGSVAA
jgi:pimeloyl-ACP methyl ester carboxylesterase